MSEMKITVPSHQATALSKLLTSSGLKFSDDCKWVLRTFTVHGTPGELEALKLRVEAYQLDDGSEDAW